MMGTYAKDTSVSVSQSQIEVEKTLLRYGAQGFMRGWDASRAILMFQIYNRQIKMVVPMPTRDAFKYTETGRARTSQTAINEAYEQACRQKWRALNLVVKAKLEAVESGISTFEDEFMAHIVLPDGNTAGEWLKPQIKLAYETKQMPAFLPMLPSGAS